MSAATSCIQRSAAQLKRFCPQKQHWNNISSKPCCKAGKSVINEVQLDSLISIALYNKIVLFMKQSFVHNYFKSNPPQKLIYTNTG